VFLLLDGAMNFFLFYNLGYVGPTADLPYIGTLIERLRLKFVNKPLYARFYHVFFRFNLLVPLSIIACIFSVGHFVMYRVASCVCMYCTQFVLLERFDICDVVLQ